MHNVLRTLKILEQTEIFRYTFIVSSPSVKVHIIFFFLLFTYDFMLEVVSGVDIQTSQPVSFPTCSVLY